MPTDVLYFLKETAKGKSLPWAGPIKLIGLDLGPFACGGADALCSTGYANLYNSLKDSNGQVIPNLLKKSGITDPGRIGFVGFSAAHGFLSPLLNNDADRARIDTVLSMDSCFGSGKVGYQKALVDAANGKMLFVLVSTTIPGTPILKNDVLHSGSLCVIKHVIEPTGLRPKAVQVRPPLPAPMGGCWQFGSLGFWVKLASDEGKVNLPHYELGKLTLPAIEAYVLPRYRGELGGGLPGWLLPVVGIGGIAAAAWWWFGRKR